MILENMNEKQINLNNEIGNILVNQNKINKKLELTNEFLKKLFLYCELEVKKYNKIIKYTVDKAIYCEDEYESPYLFVEFNPFEHHGGGY